VVSDRDLLLRDTLDAATDAVIAQDKRMNPRQGRDRRTPADITRCATEAAYEFLQKRRPLQAEKLARVRGHLEGYADALSVTGAKADIEGLITSLREDAEQLEQLDQLEEGAA
jgi:hypothetical protein